MENKLLLDIKEYRAQLESIRKRQQKRLDDISDYSHLMLKPVLKRAGTIYYGVSRPGEKRTKYLGNDTKPEVRLIREAHYLSESIAIIDSNLSLIENLLSQYESVSFGYVNMKLPQSYRLDRLRSDIRSDAAKKWKQQAESYKATFKPFRPEEMIHRTIDGATVRSKSEQSIYNHLLESGYTFVYELPLRGMDRTFFPDFTVLSEIDYKTEVRIEHQGMYGDNEYRDRSDKREYDYWKNGFLPGRDVYFTFDDNKGGFDITPVIEILKSRVRKNP